MGAGCRSHDHSGTGGFFRPSPSSHFCACHFSRSLSATIFTFICRPLAFLPPLTSTTPSAPHLPLPHHPSRATALSESTRPPHSSRSITTPLSAERGHHYYCMSSFSVPPSRSVHPALSAPACATVITALGDGGRVGRSEVGLGGVAQPALTAPSSGSVTRLLSSYCGVCTRFPAVCRLLWPLRARCAVTGYHRAIWDAEECLHQPVSAALRESLPAEQRQQQQPPSLLLF